MSKKEVKIVECPRDAMQGIKAFIPTQKKIDYLNLLLKVGFHTLDFGSFVSPKAIPQLKDTAEVLSKLDLESTKTELLAIVANERGANDAAQFDEIDLLGYPFSISETFQKRNTNASIGESKGRLEEIQNIADKVGKQLVVYLSMGFGNPYGDPYHEDLLAEYLNDLSQLDIKIFALSDTIGAANPELIRRVFSTVIPEFPNLEIGAHMHTTPDSWEEKVAAAFESGCKRFDGAIAGYGGCPMAADDLTGNMPTEKLIQYFDKQEISLVDNELLQEAQKMAASVFPL
ncbi:MAG: hydroxymethylglutaryl-CoA lyase [Vicingaceae bacterium]